MRISGVVVVSLYFNIFISNIFTYSNLTHSRLSSPVVVENPWAVNIFKFNYDRLQFMHYCTGVILNKNWILTSASCLQNGVEIEELMIVSGVNNKERNLTEQIRYIAKKSVHPSANIVPLEHDVALVKVTSDFNFDGYTEPVKLPRQDLSITGTMTVSGLGPSIKFKEGVLTSNIAQKITFQIKHIFLCLKNTFGYKGLKYLNRTIICAKKINIGNPFLCIGGGSGGICNRNVLCGIFSHKTKDCSGIGGGGGGNQYQKFSSVPLNLKWIKQVICSDQNHDRDKICKQEWTFEEKSQILIFAAFNFIVLIFVNVNNSRGIFFNILQKRKKKNH